MFSRLIDWTIQSVTDNQLRTSRFQDCVHLTSPETGRSGFIDCAILPSNHQSISFFQSYLKDSLLASSLPISTHKSCYQVSSRRIKLTTQQRLLCWRSWRTFYLQSMLEICLPLFCWTYRRPSIWSIMLFFCIDWTLPIRSWDQYNNGFNAICQTGHSTCESDLPLRHPATWCVVYPRVPSLVPYLTCTWSLRATGSICPHRYADDSQIYCSCHPAVYPDLQTRISKCIDHVAEWM